MTRVEAQPVSARTSCHESLWTTGSKAVFTSRNALAAEHTVIHYMAAHLTTCMACWPWLRHAVPNPYKVTCVFGQSFGLAHELLCLSAWCLCTLQFSVGPGPDSITVYNATSVSWRMLDVVYTTRPLLFKPLALPVRTYVDFEASRAAPLALQVSNCADLKVWIMLYSSLSLDVQFT